MGILSWALLGLLAGAIGTWIYPGRQGYGLMKTMLVGIFGGIFGGCIGSLLFDVGISGIDWRSIVLAVLGSIFVIWIFERFPRKQ